MVSLRWVIFLAIEKMVYLFMKIERLVLMLCFGAWGVLGTACSREKESAPEDTAQVAIAAEAQSLRWLGHWKGEGRREDMVRQILGEFLYAHPDVDVSFAFSADVLPEKSQIAMGHYIADMIRSGNIEWDVVWFDPMVYRTVAKDLDDWNWGQKHLVDFSKDEQMLSRHREDLVTGPDAHQFTAGMMPGPYIEGFYYSIWYNQELAEKIGIQVREEGMTENDLLDYARQLQVYNETADEPVALFLDYGNYISTHRLFVSLMLSARESLEAPTGEDAALQRTRDYFETLHELYSSKRIILDDDWPTLARALLDGEALFFMDATWRYTSLEMLDPEGLKKLRLAQMPTFADGVREVIGGYISTWAVLKNAPGRDAGIELLRYWSRPEIAEQWVREMKCPSGLEGNLYNPVFGNDFFAEYQFRLHQSALPKTYNPYMSLTELEEEIDAEFVDQVISDFFE